MENKFGKRVTHLEREVAKLGRIVRNSDSEIGKPGQYDNASEGEKNDATEESDQTPRKSAVIPKTPKNSKGAQNPNDHPTKWDIWLRRIGTLFAIGYAVVTFFQWHDLRHNFTAEQRPYLALAANQQPEIQVRTMVNGNTPFAAKIPYWNFGKGPAVKVVRVSDIFVVSNGGENPVRDSQELRSEANAWFKNLENPLKKVPFQAGKPNAMVVGVPIPADTVMPGSPDTLFLVQDKNVGVTPRYPGVLVARVEYQDGGGYLYSTDLCYYIGATQTAVGGPQGTLLYPCEEHNDIH
jgi:hypothetical protein